VAFIDVAKAFDTVSQDSILIAARRLGVSDMGIDYFRNIYTGIAVTLKSRRVKDGHTYHAQPL
jgi:hypothetical protein